MKSGLHPLPWMWAWRPAGRDGVQVLLLQASSVCSAWCLRSTHARACTHTHTHKKRSAGLGLCSGWERPRLKVRPNMPAKGSETPPPALSCFLVSFFGPVSPRMRGSTDRRAAPSKLRVWVWRGVERQAFLGGRGGPAERPELAFPAWCGRFMPKAAGVRAGCLPVCSPELERVAWRQGRGQLLWARLRLVSGLQPALPSVLHPP